MKCIFEKNGNRERVVCFVFGGGGGWTTGKKAIVKIENYFRTLTECVPQVEHGIFHTVAG